LIQENEQLLHIFLENNADIVSQPEIWRIPYHLQKEILEKLNSETYKNKQKDIVVAALEAESQIILDMYNLIGEDTIAISLNWLNDMNNPKSLITDWSSFIAKKNRYVFKQWLSNHRDALNTKIYALIFIYLHYDDIKNLDFKSSVWIRGYRLLQQNNYNVRMVYVVSVLLSLAL